MYVADDWPINNIIYDPWLGFSVGKGKGAMKVLRMDPKANTYTVLKQIKEVNCTIDMMDYDVSSGYVIFTATPNCNQDGSVFISYNTKTNQYFTTPPNIDPALDGACLFL